MTPSISVIVPVYNAAAFIDEALMSVKAALQHIPHEIIVINDGSTDDTALVLKGWMEDIVYITQKNQGAASARNAGLQQAQGQYIAFLDADDVWDHHHGQLQMDEYPKRSEAEIIIGCTQRFRYTSKDSDNKIFYGGWELLPSFGSAIIKKEVFQKVGILESSYRLHEDVDWFLRAVELGIRIATIPQVVSYYRVHDRNTTHDVKPNDHALLHVLAASLKRRGATRIPSLRTIDI